MVPRTELLHVGGVVKSGSGFGVFGSLSREEAALAVVVRPASTEYLPI